MTAWILVVANACLGAHCPDAIGFAAYRSAKECKAALAGYPREFVISRQRYCIELQQGALVVLKAMPPNKSSN